MIFRKLTKVFYNIIVFTVVRANSGKLYRVRRISRISLLGSPYLVFFLLYLNSTLGTKYIPTLDTSISQSFSQSPRLGRILPSHAAAWEESFPAHTRWRRRRPPWTPALQRTEEPAIQAERGKERTGQRRLGGRGWRPGCCSPDSLSQPAPSSSTRARPRRDQAHPRRHCRGTSVPQCHLLSDFCLFL